MECTLALKHLEVLFLIQGTQGSAVDGSLAHEAFRARLQLAVHFLRAVTLTNASASATTPPILLEGSNFGALTFGENLTEVVKLENPSSLTKEEMDARIMAADNVNGNSG